MTNVLSSKENQQVLKDPRFWIAVGVLVFSIIGVTILALYSVIKEPAEIKYVFGAVLPLLGTWVGTILAYYFSRENFESASRSIRETAKEFSAMEHLRSIPVNEKMIRRAQMLVLKVTQQKPLDQILLVGDVLNAFRTNKRNRLPILDDKGHPLYIIHRSMIDKYITRKNIDDNITPDDVKKLSLENLLDEDAELKSMFENSFATVPESASLADAKREMEKTENCLDVFVTGNGTRKAQVLGWLTNNIIVEAAKV